MPALEEQTEIVRRVEILFVYADRLKARLQTPYIAVDRLTPALLAKAFRGELVPQAAQKVCSVWVMSISVAVARWWWWPLRKAERQVGACISMRILPG